MPARHELRREFRLIPVLSVQHLSLSDKFLSAEQDLSPRVHCSNLPSQHRPARKWGPFQSPVESIRCPCLLPLRSGYSTSSGLSDSPHRLRDSRCDFSPGASCLPPLNAAVTLWSFLWHLFLESEDICDFSVVLLTPD